MERRGFIGKVLGGVAAAVGIGRVAAEESSQEKAATTVGVDLAREPDRPVMVVPLGMRCHQADGREYRYVRRSPHDHGTLWAGNVVYWDWEEDATGGNYVVTGYRQRALNYAENQVAGFTTAKSEPGDYIWIQIQGPMRLQTTILVDKITFKGAPLECDKYTPQRPMSYTDVRKALLEKVINHEPISQPELPALTSEILWNLYSK